MMTIPAKKQQSHMVCKEVSELPLVDAQSYVCDDHTRPPTACIVKTK
jgi:hypothetical protein